MDGSSQPYLPEYKSQFEIRLSIFSLCVRLMARML